MGRWPALRNALLVWLACFASTTGSGCAGFRACALPAPPLMAVLPPRLTQTGLFVPGSLAIEPGLVAFQPAFESWSDAASKRRWLALPFGTQIDTTNMDDWRFPLGTRVWKEFSLGGRRLETRFLVKVGLSPRDWAGASYVWLADGSDALLATAGAKDIAGTEHDAPPASRCSACHGGRQSYVLGFSAVQLAAAPRSAPLSLERLVRDGLLTRSPARTIVVPGDETERAALGYLHANCAHCHNQHRPTGAGPRCFDPQRSIDFSLPAEPSAESAGSSPVQRTAIPAFIVPGRPDESRMIELVSRRGGISLHMPPLGSERVDERGVQLLRRWIAKLAAGRGGSPPPRL